MVVHSAIPAFGRQRQKDHEFKASLGSRQDPVLKNEQSYGMEI
jgi:hypothetical protein